MKYYTDRGYIRTCPSRQEGALRLYLYWTTATDGGPPSNGQWVADRRLAHTWPVDFIRGFIVDQRIRLQRPSSPSEEKVLWLNARICRTYKKLLSPGRGMSRWVDATGTAIRVLGAVLFLGILLSFFWYNFVR